MDTLVKALGPAFATGLALQQLLQILDPLLEKSQAIQQNKKGILVIVSLLFGLIFAFGAGLRVLAPLGVANADLLDAIGTALIISAGTEGFNSIMKFLGYAKEEKKAEAAKKLANTTKEELDKLEQSV